MRNRKRKPRPADRGNWTDEPCYYVSVRDGPRHARLAGPFAHQRQAAAAVDCVRAEAEKVDAWSAFYAFGTCLAETGHNDGRLNDRVGFDRMPHQPRQYVKRPDGYGFGGGEQA